MTELSFTVVGSPAPQGSKRHVGKGIMVESSKKVKPWRQDVKAAALEARAAANHQNFIGPVCIHFTFILPRPRSHYRTGRNAALLRDNAPNYVATRPDISKLVRSTEDALTEAGVWGDDAQVAWLMASKTYSDGNPPGCIITIWQGA